LEVDVNNTLTVNNQLITHGKIMITARNTRRHKSPPILV